MKRENVPYQLSFAFEYIKRKVRPTKFLTVEELMKRPEALTISIKHLYEPK